MPGGDPGGLRPDVAADGTVHGFFALITDRTEPRRFELSLAQSEARVRGILEAAQTESSRLMKLASSSHSTAAERLFGYRHGGNRENGLLMPSPPRGA
jgi:PAS domain-containing protein